MAWVSELNGPLLRKDSENTVTKSNWRLERHRLAAFCEGVALVDFQTMQVLEANSALAAILGRSLDKVIGHFPWEWDAHYDRDKILAFPGLFERREIDFQVCHENVIRRPDGACVELETSFSVSEQDGKQYLFVTCRDISARKAAKRSLDRQVLFYRQAMNCTTDGIVLFEKLPHPTVIECNAAFAHMLGYGTPAEVVGLHPWDWDVDVTREMVMAMIRSGGAAFNKQCIESRHRRRDGSVYEAEVTMTDFTVDGETYCYCAVRDLTEIRRAQKERESSVLRASLATESAGIGIWEWDIAANRVTASEQSLAILEVAAREVASREDWMALLHPEDVGVFVEDMSKHLKRKTEILQIELRMKCGDGGYKWISTFGKVIERDESGWALRLIGMIRDIDARKGAEEELRNREALLSAILDHAPGAVLLVQERTRKIVQFNDHAATMHGYTPEEFFSIEPASLRVSPTPQELEEWWIRLRREGEITVEGIHRRKDGSDFEVQIRSRLITIGELRYALTIWTDISSLKAAQRTLAAQKEEIRGLVEHSADGIVRYDRGLRRVYVNAAMRNFIGPAADRINGKKLRKPGRLAMPGEYVSALKETFRTGEGRQIEMLFARSEGKPRWGLVSFTPEHDAEGAVATVLMAVREISTLVHQRDQIELLAYSDALTGLTNRNAFKERFDKVLEDCNRTGTRAALVVFDLDRFKYINDSLGHAAGDKLLHQLGTRLATDTRRDIFARLGGDEFAVLLSGCTGRPDVEAVVERIHQAFLAPFDLGQREVFTSATIGVALFPEDGCTTDDLFAHADAAMYNAKSLGRGGVQFYTRAMSEEAAQRLALSTDLMGACGLGQLELVYQPKVALSDGMCIGAEALLRWRHPEHGVISPDKFIPLAEETGAIVEIGRWVLREACRTAAEWNGLSGTPFRMAVNLSSRQFVANDIVADVRNALAATGCRGEWLECEITESLILNDDESVQEKLAKIGALGATVAIDDFGTGQSALAYLNRFHVDVLKIDRSFVSGIECDWRKAELVKAFISVAKALDMETVAEGVETSDQMHILKRLGCPIGQGYHFSTPLSETQFRQRFLSEGQSSRKHGSRT